MPSTSPHPGGSRIRIGPATAGFVAAVAVLGAVTRLFGVDAGLLALVLTVVALVVLPQVFGGPADERSPNVPRTDTAEPAEPAGPTPEAEDGGETDRSGG